MAQTEDSLLTTYNQFCSNLKGKGFSQSDQSVLWKAYKEGNITNDDLDDSILLKSFLGTEIKSSTNINPPKTPTKKSLEPKLTNIPSYFDTNKMPKETIRDTMLFLPLKSILSWCSTNKYFSQEVCNEGFWKYFLNKKYRITVKMVEETWKQAAVRYLTNYNVVEIKKNKSNRMNIDSVTTNIYKKIMIGQYGIMTFFISDDFNLFRTTESNENDELISDVIDVYFNYQSGPRDKKSSLFFIKKDGTLFYSLTNRQGVISEIIEIKNIKAAKVLKDYIITVDGDVIEWNFNNEGILLNLLTIPVPFIYIANGSFIDYSRRAEKTYNWIMGIDVNGSVWVKGDNHFNQLGTGKNGIYTEWQKMELENIKKMSVAANNTLFLDKDDNIWVCGKFGRTKIIKPKKIDSGVTDILNISPVYELYYIKDNTIYRIEKPKVIRKVLVSKEYNIRFSSRISSFLSNNYLFSSPK